jgi:hypothetical protein
MHFFILNFSCIFVHADSADIGDIRDTFKWLKLIVKEVANTATIHVANNSIFDDHLLCPRLFGPVLLTYNVISGSYIEIVNQGKRCGYVSDSRAPHKFIYMESDALMNSDNLTFFGINKDFTAVYRARQILLYDPRHEEWFNSSVDRNGMQWSKPSINEESDNYSYYVFTYW